MPRRSPVINYGVILLCGLLASACALPQAGYTNIKDVDDKSAGYVFGTIGRSLDAPYAEVAIDFHGIGTEAIGRFTFIGATLRTPKDFTEGRRSGSLFHVQLPAGEYAIHDVLFHHQPAGLFSYTYRASRRLHAPFVVKAGVLTYLGEYIAVARNDAGQGTSVDPSTGYYEVSDKMERDRELLFAKQPTLQTLPIENAVLNPDTVQLPHFRPIR